MKAVKQAGKVMATVFRDSGGINHVDCSETGRLIIKGYYASLLYRFSLEVKERNVQICREPSGRQHHVLEHQRR